MTDELTKNMEAYEEIKEELESKHFGRIALLSDGELIEIYNDSGDAYTIAVNRFGLGNFSLQKIGEEPVSLGIFTLCLPSEDAGVNA